MEQGVEPSSRRFDGSLRWRYLDRNQVTRLSVPLNQRSTRVVIVVVAAATAVVAAVAAVAVDDVIDVGVDDDNVAVVFVPWYADQFPPMRPGRVPDGEDSDDEHRQDVSAGGGQSPMDGIRHPAVLQHQRSPRGAQFPAGVRRRRRRRRSPCGGSVANDTRV